MQRGKLLQTTKDTYHHPLRREGILILLKVMALLSGYTIFVWVTMTQLERRYLAPAEKTAAAGIRSPEQPIPVPGSVVIHDLPPVSVSESAASVADARFANVSKP